MSYAEHPYTGNEIAVIGLAGRFPKSDSIDEFWDNLVQGKECITFYSDEELEEAGIPAEVLNHPNYVKAKGEIRGLDAFDASFFGINPRDAELMDPQHRMMLECAWAALEHAGYHPGKVPGSVGVYVGKSMSSYLFLNLYPHIQKMLATGNLQAAIGNDKDSMATTISYRLNLKGPSMAIQSSSSTSLVSVCMAAQSLLTYQCDMALAGGITVGPPERSGYMYEPGGIMSTDGHCRAFDEGSSGFVPGNGYGLVVLKRLEEALRDGDHIWSIIKGFAVNNDGSEKVSYTAPSVNAQSEVIAQAQALAEVDASTIGYVETHGTGTRMGDPIEIQALSQAFRHSTDQSGYCLIGSVKTNIGHLDSAAGIAGFMKATLMLHYKQIPPSLNFSRPNSAIDFENSPFYVNTSLQDWEKGSYPRRAAVNSLGMGGTNAHVILEEAPERNKGTLKASWSTLPVSAKNKESLEGNLRNMKKYMHRDPAVSIEDTAYTLATGRQAFSHRTAVICTTPHEAEEMLENGRGSADIYYAEEVSADRPLVFMFTGQGAQYAGMGQGLYRDEKVFRQQFDQCADWIRRYTGTDILPLMCSEESTQERQGTSLDIHQTSLTQPLLFAVEYALAQLLISRGLKPEAMIGHSLGEYVAAAVAGVFSLEDALLLVCRRAEWMMRMERGAMLAVGVNKNQIHRYVGEAIALAAINSPGICVMSGSMSAIEALENQLTQDGVFHKRLTTSHAFHSPLMNPVLEPYRELLSQIKLKAPSTPIMSCLSGSWLKPEQAVDIEYWARHITEPVLFMTGMEELLADPQRLFLEVGPGVTLCGLARQNKLAQEESLFVSALKPSHLLEEDSKYLMRAIAQLWVRGGSVDWSKFFSGQKRNRVPLPTYSFSHESYWVHADAPSSAVHAEVSSVAPAAESRPAAFGAEHVAAAAPVKHARPKLSTAYHSPSTETEQILVSILEDQLHLSPIGVNDNFFELGGHSLLATQVLDKIYRTLNVRLPIETIFIQPTVREIAAAIEPERSASAKQPSIEDLFQELAVMSRTEPASALAEDDPKKRGGDGLWDNK
ncbi:type I polyketide synthase [Paenibacillus zanthoxyli]|uniref:type I polyketide synthase n=1 Tax=Paenibacillus zanthoxyli TaxID=369399 RepID=UPI0004713165|nr:type I polyketide synthase [Paenibacillus zanthoxyli]